MLNGGQLPLDFFVIGESTPIFQDLFGLLAALFYILFLEKSWF
jgi:hypothetical protein